MNTANTSDSPIISTVSSSMSDDDGVDPCSACAQWLPANEYKFYIKVVMAMFAVVGCLMLGLFLLFKLFA